MQREELEIRIPKDFRVIWALSLNPPLRDLVSRISKSTIFASTQRYQFVVPVDGIIQAERKRDP